MKISIVNWKHIQNIGNVKLLIAVFVIAYIIFKYVFYIYKRYGREDIYAHKPQLTTLFVVVGIIIFFIAAYYLFWAFYYLFNVVLFP